MKRILFLFILTLFTGCYKIERKCQDFKTGEFEFFYTIDGEEKSGRFIRTQKYSVDYFDGKIDSSSIRWINDCEFILKKLNPTNNSEDDAIHMKILTTTDSSYSFEYKLAIKKLNKPSRTEKGIAYKIN